MNQDYYDSLFGQQAQYSQQQARPGQQFGFDTLEELRRATESQNQVHGKAVTDEEKRAMAIRRCGNICRDADAAGWKVTIEGGPRQYIVAFVLKDGNRYVAGKPYTTKQLALISATEALESFGFLRD